MIGSIGQKNALDQIWNRGTNYLSFIRAGLIFQDFDSSNASVRISPDDSRIIRHMGQGKETTSLTIIYDIPVITLERSPERLISINFFAIFLPISAGNVSPNITTTTKPLVSNKDSRYLVSWLRLVNWMLSCLPTLLDIRL